MALDISEIQTITHDVIVVGAGGAGLRAAIECSRQGLDTGVVCKSLLGKAHTVMAEGGAAAALGNVDARDSWKFHFRDTMRGGKFLNVWRMAEIHAKEAPERIRELEEWGAVFDRTPDGRINQRNFGGHRFPRLAHVGDRTGLEMIRTLQDKGVHSGLSVHMECSGLGLVLDGGRIAGMVGYWRDSGRFVLFRAKAVIFATGGFGKAWKITSNSWEYTGDGQRMAYEAGAELMDMEFTQFHPTGMVWPPSVAGVLVTEGVRGEGGILRNNKGERFMFKYIPAKFAAETADTEEEAKRWLEGDKKARRPPELLTRDEVARSIYNEVKEGRGSPHGGVFLNISHKPADLIKKKLPSMYHQFKELAEVDITKEAMEVGPTFHYAMGGIRVHPESQMAAVPGLFACGECGAGLHGANRLGGNSLSDLLVFGARAGLGAKAFISENPALPALDEDQVKRILDWAKAPLMREKGENPYVVHDELRESMTANVGIWRDADGMKKGIADIGTFRERARSVKVMGTSQYNPGWSEALDLDSMFLCAEATARAGLMREESRGAHSREDFQGEREEWSKYNIVIRKGASGEMEVEKILRSDGPQELSKIAKATLEELERGDVETQSKPGRRTRTLRAWRGDKAGGKFEEYTVEVDPGMVVLDLIHRVQKEKAPDLACRWNCKAGKCGSCSMEINGKPRLACMNRLGDYEEDKIISVQPLKAFPVIKDLVTDVSWNYEQNKRIAPFTPPPRPDGDYRMQQIDVDRIQEFRKCIECFLCQDTCHILRDHDKKAKFIGPRFMIRVAQLEMHPLDTVDRIPQLKDEWGSGMCNITKCCTEVCPEHINITDNGIIPLKERVVDRYYDPVTILWNRLRGGTKKQPPPPPTEAK